ncbi:MAG: hypothetical protein E7391_05145 [Ruminococcaceae bacterium]|nr:hypothetical protein [Oscillospiraceae bacterium]
MGKSLKLWLWVLIVSFAASVVMEFICVENLLGLVYALISIASVFAIVQIFKLNKTGAYVFLGLRLVESLITFIWFKSVISHIAPFAVNWVAGLGGINTFVIVVAVLRLVSAGLTVLFCELSKAGDDIEE